MTGHGQQSSAPSPLTLDPSPGLWSKRVLIIGPSNIGDAILTTDVILAVRHQFPEAHLALVVGERAKPLFMNDPRIQTLVNTAAFDTPLGRLKLALALWRYHPHVVVDLRHTFYPLLLKPLSAWRYLRRPPTRLVHMRDRHLWKLRMQVPASWGQTTSERGQTPSTEGSDPKSDPALWFTGRLGGSGVDGAPVAWTAKDVSHVEGLWKRWGLDRAKRLVVICPGARSHIKRWTAEGFARVADRLMDELDAEILFSGEPDEGPFVNEILGVMEHRAHSAVGLTTIRQLGILMTRARLVITNDSASLHLASALQVPTVAIFGPTDSMKYGPTSPRSRVVRRRLFCAPCEQPECRFHHECMRFISADEVYDAARQLLECGMWNAECGIDRQAS